MTTADTRSALPKTPPTLFYDHAASSLFTLDSGALCGLRHRTVIDQATGAAALALWQEEHSTGFHVPLHLHDCEEIITVLEGEIEATIEDESWRVTRCQSVLIPAWKAHGFRVTSPQAVKLLALFSSPAPRIYRIDGSPSSPPWEGGASDHLEG